jgi:hypothetical protein
MSIASTFRSAAAAQFPLPPGEDRRERTGSGTAGERGVREGVWASLVALLLPIALLSGSTFAAEKARKEKPEEVEAREAADEDEAEQALDSETLKKLFEGKVSLYSAQDTAERPDVVGMFRTASTTYMLKLQSPELLAQLKQYDGKQATLNGKIRNKGKFFIVVSITQAGAAPLFTRRRGGI